MTFLIFSGLLAATSLVILNKLDNLKQVLQPVPVRVRNDR